MSQQRRRRRAQQRTYGHQPKAKNSSSATTGNAGKSRHPSKPALSARARRRRSVLVGLISVALAANLVVWLLQDSWNVRWSVLTISIICIPVGYFLLVNPEKDTGL